MKHFNRRRIFFLICYSALIFESGYAQGLPGISFNRWEVGGSVFIPIDNTIEPRFSLLQAKGKGLGGRLHVSVSSKKMFFIAGADYRRSQLNSRSEYKLSQHTFSSLFRLGWFINPEEAHTQTIRLGMGVFAQYLNSKKMAIDFINFSNSSESMVMLGIHLGAELKKLAESGWMAEEKMDILLYSLANRNDYGTGEGIAGAAAGKWKSSFLFGSPMLRNSLVLGKHISERNLIGFEYVWVYYKLNMGNTTSTASHQLGLKYVFTL